MKTRPIRLGAAAAMAAAVLFLAGADEATEPVKAGSLAFKVPASWKKVTPKSTVMRKAQFTIEAAEGDKEPAELVLFLFANGGGSVEANVDRWEKMFVADDGSKPKAKVEEKKGKDVDVTQVEVSGRYVAAISPGSPDKYDKPDFRLLGGIVQVEGAGYYFRMTGPDKTVKAAKPGFEAMIKTIAKAE